MTRILATLSSLTAVALVLGACAPDQPSDVPGPEDPQVGSMVEESDMAAAATGAASGQKAMAASAADDESAGPTLAEVVADPARANRSVRDRYRNPVATLEFFGLQPDMTVVEIWPGGGWYTDILAPYLAEDGRFIAAHFATDAEGYQGRSRASFDETYVGNPGRYGQIEVVDFTDWDSLPQGEADMVLTFRNVHNWQMGGFLPEAMDAMYAMLKPGGILGVVDHRLPEDRDEAEEQSSGYMKESTVIEAAEAAGFELSARSDINANPDDTADHPFGVWTLPPTNRRPGEGDAVPEGFDPATYEAIGESDRMTLRFVKPLAADGALLQ